MLKIKEFYDQKIVFIDEDGEEYTLTADGDNKFDLDTIEDILDWEYRRSKNEHNS